MRKSWTTLILGISLVYFLGHNILGQDQAISLAELTSQRQKLSGQLATLQTEKSKLEADIIALRPESLDLDYLETLARQRLYMLHHDELMVVFEPASIDTQ